MEGVGKGEGTLGPYSPLESCDGLLGVELGTSMIGRPKGEDSAGGLGSGLPG